MPDYNPKASSNNIKYFINSNNTSCLDMVLLFYLYNID